MPRNRVADSPSLEGSPRKQVDFSKAQVLLAMMRRKRAKQQRNRKSIGRLTMLHRKKIGNDYAREAIDPCSGDGLCRKRKLYVLRDPYSSSFDFAQQVADRK